MAEVAAIPTNRGPADAVVDPEAYVRVDAKGVAHLHLLVENLHCGKCVQAIEGALQPRPDVTEARVNMTTRRLALSWRADGAEAADLLAPVTALGYRLVPFNPAALESNAAEQDRMLLRCVAVAGFAAANVMLLSVSVWAGAFSDDMGPATRDFLHWISALIAMPAVAYAGRPFFRSAATVLRQGATNMDVPISLAVLLATGMSLQQTIVSGPHAYFDASVTLLFFLLIGRYLDRRARSRARDAAEQLMLLGAVAATVVEPDGQRRARPVGAVRPGMVVAVAPGDRLPVDGRVRTGQSTVDTSLVTGETMPLSVTPGTEVFAGTLNLDAPLEVTVTAAGEGTLLAEIVRLIEAAAQGRDRYVRLADRFSRVYAPAVHLLAAGSFVGWLLLGGLAWQPALMIAVAVLIITCPCALGLAVPAVQVVASGRLMRRGVLVKAADGLERLADADMVVFDKTGTLTVGRPELTNRPDVASEDLATAASLAAASRHPLARALCRAAGPTPVRDGVRETAGMGLAAPVDGGEARLGNAAWCQVTVTDETAPGSELWLRRPGVEPVRFAFEDRLRDDAEHVVAELRRRGLAVELLSGDRAPVVAAVAERLGIENWSAGCRPADKVARLDALANDGRRVLMVGDGLNDAPALAAAHASMSPAEAADISRTAADFVFQGRRLTPIVGTLDLSRRARHLVVQNFALALAYNVIAVPIALAGLVTPLIAAVAMSSSSLIVTLNALRLRRGGIAATTEAGQ